MIPESFINEYVEKVGESTFFGVPIEKLSRKELIACVMFTYEFGQTQIKESKHQREFLLSLR